MLTCITCKQKIDDDGGEEGPRGTPRSKDSVKSLTAQIKDIALKVSGAYKCKSSTPTYTKGGHYRPYPDLDTISEGVPHPFHPSSSSSTPAWDYTKTGFQNSKMSIGGESGVGLEDDSEPKEWIAQVEPGVQITFLSLQGGGNDLKRIRFSRDMFDKWQAQRWWGENYDKIMELYNVQRFNQQAFETPARTEDGRDSTYSRLGLVRESPMMTPGTAQRNYYKAGAGGYGGNTMDSSRTTTDSREEASISVSNASEMDSEWVEEDEPGVYVTIRQLADGTRELRRVRFSREQFGEVNAKAWWEQNRDRIQATYL
ncbi:unnamed protein product [Cuscuta epithymum]|uniref:BRX domain-containing protein n=1 Tax=Cuscuta epithymum TaxID=186058 RepID=A0AAV0CQF2_9ASTE|nr:unnamed protein product [Cuscuta epithymum]CAH9137733.1 unnamed protein product [Cuscuta epithymum]